MDRLNVLNTGSPVELPESLQTRPIEIADRPRRVPPVSSLYFGLFAFTTCGLAVIVTASYIALQIQ